VLKLIYHTGIFGPIDLEYDGPIIRVGRSEDNDLVLRHPSIQPHHCLLVFRDEKVLCVSPGQADTAQDDLERLTGPEFGVGDQITIGELQFTLAHSSRTVAIPEAGNQGAGAEAWEGDTAAGASEGASAGRYFCAHCRVFIPITEAKRLGVVGRAKRYLCPKCSGVLDIERPEPPKPAVGLKKWLRHGPRKPTASSPAKP
jgi:hypothetical protein